MNYSIIFNGGLSNQLSLLYYIYDLGEPIDSIYSPHFNKYKSYFNIGDRGILSKTPQSPFINVNWGDQGSFSSFHDLFQPRFDDLKLKKHFEDKISHIVEELGGVPLIAVHFRLGDYKYFRDGIYYFPVDRYMEVARQKVKDWGLSEYKFLFFSDSPLPPLSEGILASELTGGIAPMDLFLMSQCNYFIHTHSTFSFWAMQFSRGMGKFKNNQSV